MTKRNRHSRKGRRRLPNFSGQHFLHNKKIVRELIDLAQIEIDDLVFDLGAGKGALTTVLCEKAGKVLAVEYDEKLVHYLQGTFRHQPNVKIIHQDILQLVLPKTPFKVVASIPYAITTDIMKLLLNRPSSGFRGGAILMEKGAAKRFTSSFVKDPYVILWRMWFDIEYKKGVSRNNFSPPPSVDSAMITIKRKKHPLIPMKDHGLFWGLATYVLKDPHAAIDWALRGIFTPPQLKRLRKSLKIHIETPVGRLSEQQWKILFETMVTYVPRHRWPRGIKK